MKDIAIIEYIPTFDFPYRVVILFPYELNKEDIFQTNLSHVIENLKELTKEYKMLEANERVLACLKFDSQKEKQMRLIENNRTAISDIKNKMNCGIAPYYWVVFKDFDRYDPDFKRYIKADYLLALESWGYGKDVDYVMEGVRNV